jgi:hypothetical protein
MHLAKTYSKRPNSKFSRISNVPNLKCNPNLECLKLTKQYYAQKRNEKQMHRARNRQPVYDETVRPSVAAKIVREALFYLSIEKPPSVYPERSVVVVIPQDRRNRIRLPE